VSYDPLTQRCGENDVVEYKCGNSYYNPETHFCQNPPNVVQPFCGGKIFTSDKKCEDDVVKTQCGDEWYNPLTQFCQAGTNNVEDLCGGESFTSTQRCNNNVVEAQCTNGAWYNTVTQSCQNNVVLTKCGSTWYDPLLKNGGANDWYNTSQQFCINNTVVTKGTFTFYHLYDKKNYTYKWIKIGNGAIWMAEDLKNRADYSTASTLVCYNGVSTNCTTYGGLYSWMEAMAFGYQCGHAGNSSYTYTTGACPIATNHRGACPPDWHIPSTTEWDALITSVGGSINAGTHLKAKNLWQDGNSNNVDTYGFSAMPGGFKICTFWKLTSEMNCTDKNFENINQQGHYWTTFHETYGSSSPDYSRIFQFKYNSNSVTKVFQTAYSYSSVRCVKN